MTKTTNYQLNQWAKSDRVMMDDFNADNTKIDAALKANADAAAVASAAVALCGNCKIETSTYTGTGSAGASSPTTLTFPKKPTAVIVFGEYSLLFITDKNTSTANVLCWLSDRTSWSRAKISWTGNKLKIYSETNYPAVQANMQNTVYQVIAFYAQDK